MRSRCGDTEAALTDDSAQCVRPLEAPSDVSEDEEGKLTFVLWAGSAGAKGSVLGARMGKLLSTG